MKFLIAVAMIVAYKIVWYFLPGAIVDDRAQDEAKDDESVDNVVPILGVPFMTVSYPWPLIFSSQAITFKSSLLRLPGSGGAL